MLSIEATNDKEVLDALSQKIFGKAFDGGVGFVLYNENTPIGIAKVLVKDEVATISGIGIVPEERGKGYGDFLTRSLMFNLSEVTRKIVADATCNYFLKFGFEEIDGKMVVESKDIIFPRKCCHVS